MTENSKGRDHAVQSIPQGPSGTPDEVGTPDAGVTNPDPDAVGGVAGTERVVPKPTGPSGATETGGPVEPR